MYIKRCFRILLILIFFSFIIGCDYNKRLNPNDPLSPDYIEPKTIITIISNVNINLNYENTTIIDEDTTWERIRSPIKIIQNILVTDEAVLTIEKGTDIEFYAVGVGHFGIIIENHGGINAIGTITQPIRFFAKEEAFVYLVFRTNSLDSKCVLKYCNLGEIFVYCIGANPTIQRNKMMDLSLFSSHPIVQYNDIATLLCNSSSPIVSYNLFFFTTEYKSSILIEGNSSPAIQNNKIKGGFNYYIENASSFTQYAINNYWYSTNANEIGSKIFGYYYNYPENTNYGPVIYQPFYINESSVSGAGAAW